MRGKLDEFKDQKVQLLAVDPHESWSAKYLLKESGFETSDVNYPLLTDPALVASATYGVAFQMRIHVEESNRPATFIVDREGVLRYAKRAKTFSDRPNPSDIVKELEQFSK